MIASSPKVLPRFIMSTTVFLPGQLWWKLDLPAMPDIWGGRCDWLPVITIDYLVFAHIKQSKQLFLRLLLWTIPPGLESASLGLSAFPCLVSGDSHKHDSNICPQARYMPRVPENYSTMSYILYIYIIYLYIYIYIYYNIVQWCPMPMSYWPTGMCATAARMCSMLFASLFGPVTDWCRACLGKLMRKKNMQNIWGFP